MISAAPGFVRMIVPEVGECIDFVLCNLLAIGGAKRERLTADGELWPKTRCG
jgi:hypothetical protein